MTTLDQLQYQLAATVLGIAAIASVNPVAAQSPSEAAARHQLAVESSIGRQPSQAVQETPQSRGPVGLSGVDAGAVGQKKPGVVRIGVAMPRAQLGQGSSGAEVGEPLRHMILDYVGGPGLEAIPLAARLPEHAETEARQLDCDYVLHTAVTQKKTGGGGGFGRMLTAVAPVLPMVGMTGGIAGAVAAGAVSTAATGAAGLATHVKAKDEITFEYRLVQTSGQAAPLANSASAKAKRDGEDVLTPLVEQAATSIVAHLTKK